MRFYTALAACALGFALCTGTGLYRLSRYAGNIDLKPIRASLVTEGPAIAFEANVARHAESIAPCGAYDRATRTLTVKPGFALVQWGHGWLDLLPADDSIGHTCRAKLDVRRVVRLP